MKKKGEIEMVPQDDDDNDNENENESEAQEDGARQESEYVS